jgi:predicted component of viral defense system (DUF524 family)
MTNTNLTIRNKTSQEKIEPTEDGFICLQEQTRYLVVFDEDPPNEINQYIKLNIFDWAEKDRSGFLNFGNFVGNSLFCGQKIQIDSKKISSHEFEEMLVYITERVASLPFDFNSPTYLPFDRTETIDRDVLYHNFIYLRYIMLQIEHHARLDALIHRILYNPHRKTHQEIVEKDISLASTIDSRSIDRFLMNSDCLIQVDSSSSLARTSLAQKLQRASESKSSYFPSKTTDPSFQLTIDSNENRFIKYFLESSQDLISLFEQTQVSTDKFTNLDLHRDIKQMKDSLSQMLSDNFFLEVGDLRRIPLDSQVLQKRDGYREILEHFSRMNLATNYPIDSKDLRRIIDNKDIATLYEYWVFFQFEEVLSSLLGTPRYTRLSESDETRTYLKYRIKVTYPNDVSLYYNKTFSGNRPSDKQGSYSTPLRPDITIEFGDDIYLFDAKFKYDSPSDFLAQDAEGEQALENEETEEEVQKVFKKGDLYKMHTYRDAIHNVKSVWVVYPGTEFSFFSQEKGRISILEEFGNESGVGALPIQVKTREGICDILCRLINKIALVR